VKSEVLKSIDSKGLIEVSALLNAHLCFLPLSRAAFISISPLMAPQKPDISSIYQRISALRPNLDQVAFNLLTSLCKTPEILE
jgi:hypothetical protein